MAILQCNKCANLFHDDAPHECDVERWQRLAHEGQQYFGRAIGNAPKPTTPEPPEWKEPFDPNATMYPSDFVVSPHVFVRKAHDVSDCHYCGASRFGPMACQPCPGGTIGNPPPSPLDRALEDFTARRKAKREPSMSEIVTQALRRSVRVVAKGVPVDQRTEPLSRAMSTPLPHDPSMSARLMPWRGKE